MTRIRQRGFTLIELMIALLVSSLLVGMILAIFSRMSLAYRGQQQISAVQQILAAARAALELDAKQAGLGMPQGFKTAIPLLTNPQSPVQVSDSSTAPDQVAFFYADLSAQAMVDTISADKATITVADPLPTPPQFSVGDLVVLTTSSTASNLLGGTSPDIATYDACVLRIASINAAAQQFMFDTVAPWGSPNEPHCSSPVLDRTMMYRFVAHAYRIDSTAAHLGALQRSETGGLLSGQPGNPEVWKDLAYGFSDIQTAVRIYQPAGTDVDSDGDPVRNWYSGALQDSMTRAAVPPSNTALLGMSISLVAHTDRNVEGIATAATPNLIAPPPSGPPVPDNNSLGNRPSIALPAVPADPLLPGQRIYRWASFQIDFRNLGVGLAP